MLTRPMLPLAADAVEMWQRGWADLKCQAHLCVTSPDLAPALCQELFLHWIQVGSKFSLDKAAYRVPSCHSWGARATCNLGLESGEPQ